MTTSKQWPMFDAQSLRPLDSNEVAEVESACHNFNSRFNHLLDAPYQYRWHASPLNLGDLDYDFYEFGGGQWYRDHGYGFTCAWGQILVTSFGFRWMKTEDAEHLRDWVLKHEESRHAFFPWQFLWSIVESAGHQFSKAEGAWLRILDQVDAVYPLPTGWHIISDVLGGEANWVPQRVASEMRAIYGRPGWHFGILGLWPYQLNPGSDWGEVQKYLKAKQMEMDGWRSNG